MFAFFESSETPECLREAARHLSPPDDSAPQTRPLPRHWHAHVGPATVRGEKAARDSQAMPVMAARVQAAEVDGALEERARIVRWLKAHDYWAYARVAAMIEKGEHLR